MNIIEALEDSRLLGSWFGSTATWRAALVTLKAAYGLPLSAGDKLIFRTIAGGRERPKRPVRRLVWLAGRRSGKDTIASACAVFAATCIDYSKYLRKGEIATIPLIATDRNQARTLFQYCRAALASSPALEALVADEGRTTIDLATQQTRIEIRTCNKRGLRSYSIPLAIGNEVSFWRDESAAEPDVEILQSLCRLRLLSLIHY